MPLHTYRPTIMARVLQGLHKSVGTPGRRAQVPTHFLNRLMVVAVHKCALAARQPRELTLRVNPDSVRRPLARRALLVPQSVRQRRAYVLYERPAARDIPDLQAEADRQQRQTPLLRGLQNQQVGLVAQGMHAPQFRVRLAPVEQRVNIRVAARQKNPVETGDDRFDVGGVRDQWDVQGQAPRGLDRLAVVTREVEPLHLKLHAHRYPNQWSSLLHLFETRAVRLMITQNLSSVRSAARIHVEDTRGAASLDFPSRQFL